MPAHSGVLMILAAITGINYIRKGSHSIDYSDRCKNQSFSQPNHGNLQAVIATDLPDAVKKLRIEAQDWLKRTEGSTPVDFDDFNFDIAYSKADDGGYFWYNLSTIGSRYPVATHGE
jgi:hypothetical protein